MTPRPPAPPPSFCRAFRRRFSAAPGAAPFPKRDGGGGRAAAAAAGTLLFLLAASDPVASALEKRLGEGENGSYWADLRRRRFEKNSECSYGAGAAGDGKKRCRLRNAHKHCAVGGSSANANASAVRDIPEYSRIVVVGGGMAGLHAALALAERASDPNRRGADPPPPMPPAENARRTEKRNANNDIVVLEGSLVGNGASGRAKGLVVPGFQVPLENLLENASDGTSNAPWTVPGLVRAMSGDSTPRYTKSVAEEMYNLSYAAMDRLRDIVKEYDIDCGWVECGAVEGSIHPMEEENGDDDEEEDECKILTAAQVDRIMGRPSINESSNNGTKNSNNLYKWGEYDPSCAAADPLALTTGLAEAAERWGVRIFEHARVAKLEKRQQQLPNEHHSTLGKYAVVTEEGRTIRCDHVVLCTGADQLSEHVSRRLSRSFVPVYTWMAATEPLGKRCPLKDGIADRVLSSVASDESDESNEKNDDDGGKSSEGERPAPMCGDDHVSLNYWRRHDESKTGDREGRLLFGSLTDTYPLPEWMISWRLRNALAEVYPQLTKQRHNGDDVRFDRIWGGKLAFAPNAMPLIGRDTDYDDAHVSVDGEEVCSLGNEGGVWYATAFAGHGMVPTALAGSLLADAILGTPNHQQWRLFQMYLPPATWNGWPFSRLGAEIVLGVYDAWDWMGKRGMPLPKLPELW